MKHSTQRLPVGLAATAALLFGHAATQAENLFQVDATSPGLNLSSGSSSLPDLVNDLVVGQGAFQPLASSPFFATLKYANVSQALAFDISQVAGGAWQAHLTTPFQNGLIDRTFTGPTRSDVENQIEEYLKRDGMGDWARFLKAISERSTLGPVVGNPNSSTALLANASYTEYGMSMTETADEKDSLAEAAGGAGFAVSGDVGFIRAAGLDAESYSVTPYVPVKLSSRVRLDFGLPLNYTTVSGAEVFRGGLQVALPVLLVKRNYKEGRPWLWQVTPHANAQVTGSYDMVAGGLIVAGGATSMLIYDFGKFELSMGNHFSFYESADVTFGDYDLDPQVSNQIVKNGLKIGVPLGRRWYAEAYAIDTELLGSACAMSRYTTVGGGIGYRFLGAPTAPRRKTGYTMVGAYSNFGDDYSSANVLFGAGWKF